MHELVIRRKVIFKPNPPWPVLFALLQIVMSWLGGIVCKLILSKLSSCLIGTLSKLMRQPREGGQLANLHSIKCGLIEVTLLACISGKSSTKL